MIQALQQKQLKILVLLMSERDSTAISIPTRKSVSLTRFRFIMLTLLGLGNLILSQCNYFTQIKSERLVIPTNDLDSSLSRLPTVQVVAFTEL